MPNPNDKIVPLSPEAKLELACAKATCPFIGGAIVTGRLAVRNELQHPLASIDDVRHLGNEGGGDLGELLAMFASGNHALMRNDAGELVSPVPEGLF
ncbi:MAG: hypothetical protein HY273_17265, partial [Gammaproteobacteria bacterium]|nr:hypothetical protein [Gammaproteobacteria bacterium]